MPGVTCLRLSDVGVICRVAYFQFPIQSVFLQCIVRHGRTSTAAYYWIYNPVHTSNNVEETGNIVEATFDFVEATFDFVATNGNNVERFHCKMSSFRQSRNKLNTFNLFRLCRKDEILFDIVAENGNIVDKNGNNVESTFDTVERIVQLVAFDNVASTLLLVWTGLNTQYRTSDIAENLGRYLSCAERTA